MSTKQYMYNFGSETTDGDATMRDLLGGKGANLAEMCRLHLPVPPGFTISTDVCREYYKHHQQLPKDFEAQIEKSLKKVEKFLNKELGNENKPLLLSVRSGARESMPGMMDTILNLGLNDLVVEGLAQVTNDPRFAYDSYRRFIQMYADVVCNISILHFEDYFDIIKHERGAKYDSDLQVEDLKNIVQEFKKIFKNHHGSDFPQDVHQQLLSAIKAVFDSWMCHRAITYRKINQISAEWGTAANIQAMVFGNMGDDSATGVIFTRNPSTGENILYGEYLINAQGEDVVAGTRTPFPIAAHGLSANETKNSMEIKLPQLFKQINEVTHKLEQHYKDMQDIEFTVEKGKLWILQTRNGKRTTQAALKIAVDLWKEKILSKEQALLKIQPSSLQQLLHPTLDPKAKKEIVAKGLPASPGAASGIVVFSAEDAERYSEIGERVILVRVETSPEDISGMYVAKGILTSRGGMTSHAAVVARGMGKPCIAGAGDLHIDYHKKHIKIKDQIIAEKSMITIDGSSGEVMLGEVPTVQAKLSGDFDTMINWANQFKRLKIRTNAETAHDIKAALSFGAEGIGLCRTEHMFFEADRITSVRKMIVAQDVQERKEALAEILPMQKQDFVEIFSLMKSLPVNIRLLDMPLHEFVPKDEKEYEQLSKALKVPASDIQERCKKLHEINPMLGHRGSRLGITYPEIYQMQVQAIMEAMHQVQKERGIKSHVEIMVPLIASENEMKFLRSLIAETIREVEAKCHSALPCDIGTMIELPRAALRSAQIAELAEYMSYGTNDLSQTTFGLSRDDSANFIQDYIDKGILTDDPFACLDQEGVGELIKISAERARSTRPNIKLGICGEHGGDPRSVHFFDALNFDYVSCSPYRIHIARLAAAQAQILHTHKLIAKK